MRFDFLVWFGRLVVAVFVIGALALIAAVTVLVRQAEGVPPMPIAMGMVGMAALVLLAGAAVSLVSIAHSVRRAATALERQAANAPRDRVGPVFSGPAMPAQTSAETPAEAPVAAARPQIKASRSNRPTVVAQR
ncbi:hypothetical protein Q4511_03780 [Paracoccus sp. 1_MG-2023]|uniref:hypothetical protein n=1 Tax=unclassified Paracoccus (in: a-proteobacteria) TaxID=2688777 RepID=UPI001C08E6A3|nr:MULTISPECIES: hypothetical protein [unclassified Paracoccus (in: a-proteobacteria)]MBU2956356.1 hypothetical protein [Paracoccus sp. C2R09]MDO6668032.1 hypothetical protein [Paracoccus sp. 1_MG-2023]